MGTPKYIYLFITLAVILFISCFIQDWIVFYQCGAVDSCLKSSSHYQHITKSLIPVIATIMTFCIGKNCVGVRDRRFLQAAFIMIICADACFKIFHNFVIPFEENTGEFISFGIIFFLLAQLLLVFRHTRVSEEDRSFPWILFFPLAVAISMAVLYLFGIYDSIMFFASISYGPFLFCSLYAAWKASSTGLYPKRNARQIKLGMIFFTICDLMTGIALITGPDHSTREIIAVISNNLIWCLYTPALLLLALSGYRHDD